MHLRELFFEPVNFIVSFLFILSVGFVFTSVILDNAGLPNPIAYFGGQIGLMLLDKML